MEHSQKILSYSCTPLYVITITLENICDGKEDIKLYQRFFKSIGSAKKQLSELRKKILDKGYNYAFSGKNYHCGDGSIWYCYDNDNFDEVTITLEDDLGTFYKTIDNKFVLNNSLGSGCWDSEEKALKDIFNNPKYTFDRFF